MTYRINGSAMSLAPFSVRWQPIPIGLDHNRQTLYSAYADVVMRFDSACPAYVAQWINAVSSGSVNLTTLDRLSISFTTLSGAYIETTEYPDIEDVHTTPFTLTVKNAPIFPSLSL